MLLARAHHVYGAPPLAGTPAGAAGSSTCPTTRASRTLCLASDALVTDYSSLMFDYANLDRPIVVHADDWEAYEAARGTYFDLRAFPPGAVAAQRGRADRHLRDRPLARLALRPAAGRVPRAVLPVRRRARRRTGRTPAGAGRDGGPAAGPPLAERHPVPSAAAAFAGTPLASVPHPQPSPDGTPSSAVPERRTGGSYYSMTSSTVDVAAGRVGVGADLVGLLDQLAAGLLVHGRRAARRAG